MTIVQQLSSDKGVRCTNDYFTTFYQTGSVTENVTFCLGWSAGSGSGGELGGDTLFFLAPTRI